MFLCGLGLLGFSRLVSPCPALSSFIWLTRRPLAMFHAGLLSAVSSECWEMCLAYKSKIARRDKTPRRADCHSCMTCFGWFSGFEALSAHVIVDMLIPPVA